MTAILVVTNLYPPLHIGGYELSCESFVDHMRARDCEVHVLTGDAHGSAISRETDVSRRLRSYLAPDGTPRPLGARGRLATELHNRAVFRSRLAELDPDLVMWWNMGGLSLSLLEQARRAGLPAVGVVCDAWMTYAPMADAWMRGAHFHPRLGAMASAATRIPARVDLATAARWVFVSHHVRREAERALGEVRGGDVVPCGVPTERFARRPPDTPWRGRLVFVGRVTPDKGVDVAIEAAAASADCSLDVYGAGDERYVRRLESAIATAGAGDRIRLHGQIRPEDVYALYADHDALLFTTTGDEGCARVPLEAMAAGIPVVGAPRGGTSEYLVHEVNCLTAFSPAEFAAAVKRLGDDPELRRRLAETGTEVAGRHHIDRTNEGRAAVVAAALAERPGR